MVLFPDSFSGNAVAIFLLFIAVFAGCSSKEKKDKEVQPPSVKEMDLLSVASVKISGWQEKETRLLSKANDMSEYANDEAELYFAYGLRRLAVKRYENEDALPMLVEVYEFDSSEDAYGVYSFDTVGDKLDIGQDSVYGYGLLKFWKDRLLVKVIAEEEYSELEEDVMEFGRQINSGILTTGSRPSLLSLAPKEKLIPDSLHFFHENICLNNIYYIPESVSLGFSKHTDALTAQYDLGGRRPPRLLLIDYPDETAAKTGFTDFGISYFRGETLSPERRINIVKMGAEEYDSITLSRNYVILVLEARSPDSCKRLVAATLANIELYGESIGQ